MADPSEIRHLISAANAGDKEAQEEFFAKLSVRFSKLITRELQKYPMLANGISLDKKSHEVCQYAMSEVKILCPLCNPNFSLMQVMNVLHNVLDTIITNSMVALAKKGNREAENLLFMILRKRLIERIIKKRNEGEISSMRSNEDLVHEALIIIYEKYKDIEFERGVLPWAYGVLDRVMSGEYRTGKRRESILNNHINEVINIHDHQDYSEEKATSFELVDEIWSALDQLNNKEKEIFKLKLQGFSGEEIQEKLGISRSVLDVSVFRGRKKLKKKLKRRGVL